MLAMGASVVLRSTRGERVVPIGEFLVDTFTTSAEPDELLTEIRVPTPPPSSGGTYLKLERKVGDWATVGVAVALTLSNGSIGRAGIGLTGVGLKNIEATDAEQALAGAEPTDEAFADAGRRPPRSRRPVTDVRGPEDYKRHMIEVYVRRGLAQARDAASGGVREDRAMQITVTVNGTEHTLDVEPRELLVHVIREESRLTGTHIGCDTSGCGACTVLLDGQPVKSCTLFGVQADGRSITTVEGLMADGALSPMQAAFKEEHGLQCGYCTPGMMLVGSALIERNPDPSDEDVRWAISGNVCRCTGYMNIVKAIQTAAAETRDAAVPASA